METEPASCLATAEGLQIHGSLGLLEISYRRGYITDSREIFRRLLSHSYIDKRLLGLGLESLGLPSL